MHRMKCKIGDKFGRLTLLERISGGRTKWRCLCDCGKTAEVLQQSLLSGNTKSCGCLVAEKNFKHGGYYTSEYSIWSGMKARCYNPRKRSYGEYGGRGISVCERWRNSFPNFLADLGKRPSKNHSLERVDVNGNYEPANCRWATSSEQANNKRDNNLITFRGETLTETQWRRKLGFNRGTIRQRIVNGWSVEDALTTPSRHKKSGGQTYP